MSRRMDGTDGTYTTSDTKARAEEGHNERNGDIYTSYHVTKPIDLVDRDAKLRGS